jgi:solute carrier family 25 (mitochondrial adenine nucleotide translocator), member 4/5/6/31
VDKDTDFWLYFLGNLASGAATGATSAVVVHPLDFARTRLGADIGRVDEEREFLGVWDCIRKICRSDGITGLYQGFVVSIIGNSIYRGIHFGFYDTTKSLIEVDNFFLNWFISQVKILF